MITLLLFSCVAFTAMWLVAIHACGIKTRLFLARRPWLFLLLHLPIMYGTTFIGGEGLIVAVSSIIGGAIAQIYLQLWGMKHGLTFMGKKTIKYNKLHPKKKKRNGVGLFALPSFLECVSGQTNKKRR